MNEWLNGLDRSALRTSGFRGPFTLSLNIPLVHSFTPQSFVLPTCTHCTHSFMRSAIHAHMVHSFPAQPPFLPGACAHVAPRAQPRPRAPRVRPGWALRGEPLNQPRLRGAGAGGKPGWGRGAGAPRGKPGGVGEPRPHRLQARSASVGRARARGGGGEQRPCRGHVDWRPAAGPAPPGGEYLRAGRARRGRGRGGGAGTPTPRGGLCSATEAPAPPPGRGRLSSLSTPPRGAPSRAGAPGPRGGRFIGQEEPARHSREPSALGAGRVPGLGARSCPWSGGSRCLGPVGGVLTPTTRVPAAGGRVGQGEA